MRSREKRFVSYLRPPDIDVKPVESMILLLRSKWREERLVSNDNPSERDFKAKLFNFPWKLSLKENAKWEDIWWIWEKYSLI